VSETRFPEIWPTRDELLYVRGYVIHARIDLRSGKLRAGTGEILSSIVADAQLDRDRRSIDNQLGLFDPRPGNWPACRIFDWNATTIAELARRQKRAAA
jgi:hypothetical protein